MFLALISGALALASFWLQRNAGLTRTILIDSGPVDVPAAQGLSADARWPLAGRHGAVNGRVSGVHWRGDWYVPESGVVDLILESHTRATWRIDGQLAAEHLGTDAPLSRRTVLLTAGFHAIELDWRYEDGGTFAASWAPAGESARPLTSTAIVPEPPSRPMLWVAASAVTRWVRRSATAFAMVIGLALVAAAVEAARRRIRAARGETAAATISRRAAVVTLLAIALYGGALRLDAITGIFGVVSGPAWIAALQQTTHQMLTHAQPAGIAWTPAERYPHPTGPDTHYRSDPYTYLLYARAMRHFSDAHQREPIFPFTTKVWLRVLDDQDVAVSFASAMYAVLSIVFTYLVGATAFSRPVGLIAAAAFAVEYTAVAWDVAGWRDPAFTCGAVAFTWALLRCTRAPTWPNAALVGFLAAFAFLVRVTALSFLGPGLLWLFAFGPRVGWRRRWQLAGLAALVATVLAAPYVTNCWRVYGDPLYALNAVTPNLPDSQTTESSQGAFHYLKSKAAARPFEMIDTALLGLTVHPFTNKWDGFVPWLGERAHWMAIATALGLLMFLGSSVGRLLLAIVVTATIPFCITWQLAADWRYTEHTYPFFLIAAAIAISRAAALPRLFAHRPDGPAVRRHLRFWTPLVATLVVVAAAITWGLPVLIARESFQTTNTMAVAANERDRAFFRRGWSPPITSGMVTSHVPIGPAAAVWMPLDAGDAYDATLRLDPFPRPLGAHPMALPIVRGLISMR